MPGKDRELEAISANARHGRSSRALAGENMKTTRDPENGLVAILDALGAADYSDAEIQHFMRSRENVLDIVFPYSDGSAEENLVHQRVNEELPQDCKERGDVLQRSLSRSCSQNDEHDVAEGEGRDHIGSDVTKDIPSLLRQKIIVHRTCAAESGTSPEAVTVLSP